MPRAATGERKLGVEAHLSRVQDIRQKRADAQESIKLLRAELKKDRPAAY